MDDRWPHSSVCTTSSISPTRSPVGLGRSISVCTVVCDLGTPLGPTHGNGTVSGRDCHCPSSNRKTTGRPPVRAGWVWSLSSSSIAAAEQYDGVQDERNAHQVVTSGGCGLGV